MNAAINVLNCSPASGASAMMPGRLIVVQVPIVLVSSTPFNGFFC